MVYRFPVIGPRLGEDRSLTSLQHQEEAMNSEQIALVQSTWEKVHAISETAAELFYGLKMRSLCKIAF